MNGSEFQVLAVLNGTAFYVLGICLASLALIVTAIGLREKSFPSAIATRIVIVIFALLVVGTATFAVRYSRNEQTDRRAKIAAEEKEALSTQAAATTGSASSGGGGQAPKGPGGTVKLAADPTQLAYDTKALSSKPGKLTIDFNNPAPIQHDVAIAQGSKTIATSKLISGGSTTVSADLAPGKYVFFCTVPGHREAGMQGTLTVK